MEALHLVVMVEMADLVEVVMVVMAQLVEQETLPQQVQHKEIQVEMLMMLVQRLQDTLAVEVVALELLVVMEQDLLESEVLVVVECQIQF